MNKKGKGILIGTGVVAAGVAIGGILSHSITKYMIKVAMHRELPKMPKNPEKSKKQLRGFEDKEEFLLLMEERAIELEGQETQCVEIQSFDGETLVGHWYPCENAKRVIVAMHGWRSSWSKDFGMIADFWHNQDCSVLFAEQRGQNNSGGEYMGFGLLERYDCAEWVKWVNEKIEKSLPIYLAGVSMGATTVLMASGLELPENVCGIMADCGFTSPHAIWKHVAENNLHLSYRIRGKAAEDLCRKKIQMGSKDYSTTDAMKVNKLPIIFVHGTEDHFVPIEMTYENYKACVAPKRLVVVPGADHGMSYYLDKKRYEQEAIAFWEANDSCAQK